MQSQQYDSLSKMCPLTASVIVAMQAREISQGPTPQWGASGNYWLLGEVESIFSRDYSPGMLSKQAFIPEHIHRSNTKWM